MDLVCIDADFRIVHVSDGLPQTLVGSEASALLGDALFEPGGALREALRDPRVRYLVLLRSALDEPLLFGGMIASSPAMTHLFDLIEHLKSSDATVLLTGESGTGRETVARAIHDHSPRCRQSFVALSGDAVTAELLESATGTLFIDAVDELPPALQPKLLHILEQQPAGVRIIAATHVDLRRAVAEGKFREDLYYRLRVVPIEIPPLRERREDVEPLARSLLSRIAARQGRQLRFSPEAIRKLQQHTWPGNVRELENAIEYAVAVTSGPTIVPEDLPIETAGPAHLHVSAPEEIAAIRAALDQHHWRRDAAARALGMSRTTLWRKMREYHL